MYKIIFVHFIKMHNIVELLNTKLHLIVCG